MYRFIIHIIHVESVVLKFRRIPESVDHDSRRKNVIDGSPERGRNLDRAFDRYYLSNICISIIHYLLINAQHRSRFQRISKGDENERKRLSYSRCSRTIVPLLESISDKSAIHGEFFSHSTLLLILFSSSTRTNRYYTA